MYVPYIVAEPDLAKAEALIKSHVAKDDELVDDVGPLNESVIEAFHLRPGEFTHLRAIP